MSNLSINNNVINSYNRSKYINKLKGNIGVVKEGNRTPIHYKLMDKYEDIASQIPKRNIFIFCFIFVLVFFILYYFKFSFILKPNEVQNTNFKISSSKNNNKIVSYWKLTLYSLIITIILYTVLYFTKNKVSYIGKLFDATIE
jgi:hypothetical protein